MSTREIQQFIYQRGEFTFFDGKQDEGMVICRYNIAEARIEYYLIPVSNVLAYQAARAHSEVDAHKKLGWIIDIGKITNIKIHN